jgi:integrase
MMKVAIDPKKRHRDPKYQGVFFRMSSVKRHKRAADKCFDICYRDRRGKLIWEKVGWVSEGYTAVEASQVRADRLRAIRHGDELPKKVSAEVTLGKVWEKYDEWLNTSKRQPEDDRGYYKKHIEPIFKDRPLSKISPFDIEKLKIKLTNRDLAPATVKHVLVLIRQLINKAIAWGMWSGENPIKKVKLPRLNNQRERFLSKEEAKKILEEVQKVSPHTYDICLLSLHTGMRAGEIFDLKWSHIDTENGLIHIADPKSGRARKAFMTKTIKRMFQSLEVGKPEDYVFPSRDGVRIDRVSNSFMRAVDELKLNEGITDPRQKVVFHSLRHTFASWLAIQGTPILTIKELLGHQSLAMTERYSHLSPDHKRQAVEGIERVFRTGAKSKDVKVTVVKGEKNL